MDLVPNCNTVTFKHYFILIICSFTNIFKSWSEFTYFAVTKISTTMVWVKRIRKTSLFYMSSSLLGLLLLLLLYFYTWVHSTNYVSPKARDLHRFWLKLWIIFKYFLCYAHNEFITQVLALIIMEHTGYHNH